MASRRLGIALAVLFAMVSPGCVSSTPSHPSATPRELLDDARSRALPLEDPLAIDASITRAIDRDIDRGAEPDVRMRRLVRYVSDRAFGFRYERGTTLPVRTAFRERRGDCLTYALLLVALSRYLNIDTYFVYVDEVDTFYDRDQTLFASSHLAIAEGPGPAPTVIDVAGEPSPWKLSSYRRIDDAAAVALYHNNRAVDLLVGGEPERAATILGFLAEKRPELAELQNNQAVALLRARHPRDALHVLEHAIDRFPAYKPLYTNAVLAALASDLPELARVYEARGAAVEGRDPLFVVARGARLYAQGSYREAIAQFQRAMTDVPESPVVAAWLARAHASAGDIAAARVLLRRARGLHAANGASSDVLVRQVEAQFPALRGEEHGE